jgi:anaerobic ribonucleoside-triphosphate reductase activating protein
MLSFEGGTPTDVEQIVQGIRGAQADLGIEGTTLMGGEPFAHAEPAAELASQVQALGLTVMVFSGFTLRELADQTDPGVRRLLAHTDILVDGRYRQDQPDTSRRWIGSTNQQIHFLTDRYSQDDPCWRQSETLEIRMQSGEISVNGFPAAAAVDVWKRPRTRPIGKR